MYIGLLVLIFYAFGCATKSSAPPTSQADVGEIAPGETQQLQDIQVVDENTSLDVLLVGSNAMTYTAFKAIDPLRLVLDLPNTESKIVSSPLAVENEIIGKIETMTLAQEPQPLTRVEIALNQETPYEIFQEENQIRVQFEKSSGSGEARAEPAAEKEMAAAQTESEPQAVVAAPQPAAAAASAPAKKITAIQPIRSDEEVKVYIIGDGSIGNYNVFTLTDPARVVLDLMGVKLAATKGAVPPSDKLLKNIRVGEHPEKVRVVFDLIPAAGLPYQVTSVDDRLVVSFKPGKAFPPSPPIVVAAPAAAPPKKAAKVKKTPPPAEPARITSINFNLLESNKSRLTVSASRPLEPEIQITGANSMSMIFPNTKLPKHLERHIDTGQFASAVNVIYPRPMKGVPGTVEFYIEMREMVPYHIAQEDDKVYLDFDRSTLPPTEPIKLGKPATVVEERGPLAPMPAEVQPPPAPEEMAAAAPPAPEEEIALEEVEAADKEALAAVSPPESREAEVGPTEAMPAPPPVKGRYLGQKISLDLQEVDIRNVLRLLADVTGKNIVVEPNVKGTVTLKVDNVPWDQVLELILKINDLDSVMEGNVIRIATAAKIKSELDRRREEVEAQKELMAAARDLGEITTEYLQVNYADVNDISAQLKNVQSEKGSISVDSRTNLIIYSDFPKRIEVAKEILARLDRATQQVMIESRIVSATTNFSRNLGISWNAAYTANSLQNRLGGSPELDFAVAAPTSAIGTFGIDFARTIGVNNLFELDMQLDALEQAGEGRVISSPRIFTLDHVQAMIQQGDQIPYPQRTEEGTISTAFAPATLSLTVTPHITPDGKVRMEVLAKKDEADFSRTVQDVPAIRTQEAQTELLVNDG
ncbi:MAG: type IV pilus secretin PilQ, partial [Deltaproteobacteria bacterium]|nr:type IV pilus secretin PilQ [Deltaproteobacteria bacterium]